VDFSVLRVERCDAIRCDGGRGDCRGGQALIGIDTGRVNRLMIGTHHRCIIIIIIIYTVQYKTVHTYTSRISIDPPHSLDLGISPVDFSDTFGTHHLQDYIYT
jgi:hypothetical protein